VLVKKNFIAEIAAVFVNSSSDETTGASYQNSQAVCLCEK